jgi:hypothetical protein
VVEGDGLVEGGFAHVVGVVDGGLACRFAQQPRHILMPPLGRSLNQLLSLHVLSTCLPLDCSSKKTCRRVGVCLSELNMCSLKLEANHMRIIFIGIKRNLNNILCVFTLRRAYKAV